jgi:hypothetical protein
MLPLSPKTRSQRNRMKQSSQKLAGRQMTQETTAQNPRSSTTFQ